ncbi:MAG: hypothetical protein KDI71_18090 [Xanthomonadales bacterium]|nr:hypothetical protein [Xanthomonadales bacterium]
MAFLSIGVIQDAINGRNPDRSAASSAEEAATLEAERACCGATFQFGVTRTRKITGKRIIGEKIFF